MPIRVLVVDDEPLARRGIVARLERAPDIVVAGECGSGRDAVQAIAERRPDLVYLDVQMPGMSGFDVVSAIDAAVLPEVVFVTAHDEFALAAFEANAIDYLLKPIDPDRFERALARARQRIADRRAGRNAQQIATMLASLHGTAPACDERHLLVKDRGRLTRVDESEIEYVCAEGDYVRIHTPSRRYLVRETLQAMEAKLDPARFVRIHRSTIVKIDRVRDLQAAKRVATLTMRDGTRLKVSDAYRETLRDRLRPSGE